MTELKVFDLPVGKLVEYANNSKVHDEANVDAIMKSIERFGMCDPVGVWKNAAGEYEIVEGHGRKLALEQLGYDTVPCVDLSHLTDEERRVYSHVHNQTTLMSDLDVEIAELDFDDTEFDMESFGFSCPQFEEYDVEEYEEKERDVKIEDNAGVFVACDNEIELEKIYKRLTGEGYSCRILTL